MQMTVVAGFAAGFSLALVLCYLTLKYRVEISRNEGRFLVLKLPFPKEIKTHFRVKYPGVFVDEWEEMGEKLLKLGRLVKTEIILSYARDYRISYVGLEGDRPDGQWSEGKLAYSLLGRDYRDGYSVFLNPYLDLEEVSKSLSLELGETILPSEVQTFLFLHEVGHTFRAGNSDYLRTLIDNSFYDGESSASRELKVIGLRRRIERFSDQFALRELHRLRKARPLRSVHARNAPTHIFSQRK